MEARIIRVLTRAEAAKAEAVEQFRRALELQPEFAAVHNNLGFSLRELKQPDDAATHFNRAVELDPDNVAYWEAGGAVRRA